MKIFWTDFARSQLALIFKHYRKITGQKPAQTKVAKIVIRANDLQSQPKMGPKESYLAQQPEEFRYLIHGNYKIIYWVDDKNNQVNITDVFDTWQDPSKLKSRN